MKFRAPSDACGHLVRAGNDKPHHWQCRSHSESPLCQLLMDTAAAPAANLASLYGSLVMTHNLFECKHAGAMPPSRWIADAPVGMCTRKGCSLAAAHTPISPVETDRATLEGTALLVCHRCLLNGRQPHSIRAGVSAQSMPTCRVIGCGYPLYIRVISAAVDADRWIEQGHQRLAAAQKRASTAAQAPLPAAPVALDAIYDLDRITEPTIIMHYLYECNHGDKKAEATRWIANTPLSECRKPSCREKRRQLTPVKTDRATLEGFGLLVCPQCLDEGRMPNTTRTNVRATDELVCKHPQCGSPLRIRAIVARADIDRWFDTGRRWIEERAARDAAENTARVQALQAQNAEIAEQCATIDNLKDIYPLTAGRDFELAMTVATTWLGRNHRSWSQRHPEATTMLATLLNQSPTWTAYAQNCSFCGTSLLLANSQVQPEFCAMIRRHLLLPHATPTVSCGAETCTSAACATCRAPPIPTAAAAARPTISTQDLIPGIDAGSLAQTCRRITSVESLRDAVQGHSDAAVHRVARDFLERIQTPRWLGEHPGIEKLLASILTAGDEIYNASRCSFCDQPPLAPGAFRFSQCVPLGTHLTSSSHGPTVRCTRAECDKPQCAACTPKKRRARK